MDWMWWLFNLAGLQELRSSGDYVATGPTLSAGQGHILCFAPIVTLWCCTALQKWRVQPRSTLHAKRLPTDASLVEFYSLSPSKWLIVPRRSSLSRASAGEKPLENILALFLPADASNYYGQGKTDLGFSGSILTICSVPRMGRRSRFEQMQVYMNP
jgi:hypothetical protein